MIADAPFAAAALQPTPASLTPFISLFSSVAVGVVSSGAVPVNILTPMMDAVGRALKSKVREIRASGIAVLSRYINITKLVDVFMKFDPRLLLLFDLPTL